MAAKPSQRHRVRTTFFILVGIIALAMLGGNFGVAAAYAGKAKPGVCVGGVGVAGKSPEDIARIASEQFAGVMLSISVRGSTFRASVADLGASVNTQKTVDNVMNATRYSSVLSALNYVTTTNVPLVFTYDAAKMQNFLDSHLDASAKKAVDATVTYSSQAQSFVVKPGTSGDGVDMAPVVGALNRAAADPAGAFAVQTRIGVTHPAVSTAEARVAATWANTRLASKITLETPGKTPYTLKPSDIAPWIVAQSDAKTGVFDVAIDADAVAQTLPGLLESAYAVKTADQVTLVTPDGTKVATSQYGVNGKAVSDPATVVGAVVSTLDQAKDAQIPVSLVAKKFVHVTETIPDNYDDPHGAKWVDVDLTTQTETLWEGTTQVARYTIASGATTGGRSPTPTGTFYVWLKYASQTMTGGGPVGSPTHYVTPDVPWVSYFDQRGDALHGAPWLTPAQFGTPRSHGCINMEVSQAQFVYNWAPIGTKVVVRGHYPGQ